MKEYKVVFAFGIKELEAKITEMLKDGWQPTGGITFSKISFNGLKEDDIVWAQAMVR